MRNLNRPSNLTLTVGAAFIACLALINGELLWFAYFTFYVLDRWIP